MQSHIWGLDKLIELSYVLGACVCHQLAGRSLIKDGSILPLCARCTGIHFGIWAGLFFLLLTAGKRMGIIPNKKIVITLLAAVTVAVMDRITVADGWRAGSNGVRLMGGLYLGYSLSLFMGPIFKTLKHRQIRRSTISITDILGGALVVTGLWPILYFSSGSAICPMVIFEGASVIGVFTLGWGALLALILWKLKGRPLPCWLWLCSGLCASLVQLGAMIGWGVDPF